MKTTTRYESVDALRGFIMILMAIDHASATIARQHASEFWAGAMSAYDSAFPFLTRWVTHLCAPGFFFLMGAGITGCGVTARRRLDGIADRSAHGNARPCGFLVAQVFEAPLMYVQNLMKPAAVSLNRITAPPPIDGSALYWGLITLSGLGMVMLVCALLLRLPRWAWLAVAAASVFITNTLLPSSGKVGPLWMTILYAPGLSSHLFVVYPVIPWLAASAAGMYFAWWWRANPDTAPKRTWMVGAALVVCGVLLRAAGGWGNIRPPRDAGWIEFLNNVKYPPSLVFLTMFIGIDLLVLALLQRLPAGWKAERSPLLVFGQTPLFFYIAHFYLLGIAGLLFFHEAGSLEMAYAGWGVVLVLLYPVCVWYRRFKMSKPAESLWRLF